MKITNFTQFKIDDTSNEKRRSLKIRPKNGRKQKMRKVKILTPTLGENIRFRERE